MTVGKASFEDCDRLTSSLGWIGDLPPRPVPASSLARPAMTSLAFMFVWVPEPVWNTTSGNSPSSRPSIDLLGRPLDEGRLVRRQLAQLGVRPSGAHSLRMPRARMTGRPQVKRPTPIRKFSTDRWVWAPQ